MLVCSNAQQRRIGRPLAFSTPLNVLVLLCCRFSCWYGAHSSHSSTQPHTNAAAVTQCPLKVESEPSLRALAESSHQLVMITGDAPLTACYAAGQVHIVTREVLILQHRCGWWCGVGWRGAVMLCVVCSSSNKGRFLFVVVMMLSAGVASQRYTPRHLTSMPFQSIA